MKTSLDGQVAIVTGAARGIGLGIAKLMAERGAKVVVWDRDLAPLQAAGFEPALAQAVDVASYASVEAAFNAAVAQFGKVDILVNNAGINGPIAPTWEYPLEDWDRVVAIDMTAVFYASRLAAKHMRENKYGRIVTVASIAGKEGVPNISAYSAAKAGVIGFSKALAKELCDVGVTVNCIAPAMTETPLLDGMTEEHIRNMKAKIPMGRFVQVDEIGRARRLDREPGLQLHHRLRVRHHRRPRHLLRDDRCRSRIRRSSWSAPARWAACSAACSPKAGSTSRWSMPGPSTSRRSRPTACASSASAATAPSR